ncbi:MAG TPA: LuxR C-terminal-related transcriptional regulator [Kribbella sp.]
MTRPTTVARCELIDLLDRAATKKVTIISAPPGSGKTTLLRMWADRPPTRGRVASVSVRRGEKDPQHFWLSLLKAERAVSAPDGPLETLAPSPEFDASMVVDKMLQQLTRGDQPRVLVIDDLNELESREAMEQLEQMLVRLPPGVRVVLASRRDPRLRLHQLRLEGELTEIRAADLAFSADEAAQLLKGVGVQLRESDVALLQERTEGWAAGLRLAAISLQGRTDPEQFVAEFSGSERTVAEYLLVEMLERQPAEVRHLLLRTSIVDRINGALGDVLTGTAGSEQTFHALEDANAFVVSLDPERSWFRYHYLFGDLLRLELRRTAPGEVPDLHRRAAEWFATHGHVVEAIRHAQAAEAWDYAARLLVDNALNLTLDGQAAVIHDLLGRFPPAALQADPELSVVLAADQVEHGSLDDAAAYLALAEVHLNHAPPERRPGLDVTRAVVKLLLARRRGDFSNVLEQVEFLARPDAVRSHAAVALSGELRTMALMNLGIVEMWSLDLAEAEKHLEDAVRLARRTGRAYLEVGCLAHLGFAANAHSFGKGRKRCREAITLAESHGWGESHVIAPALATLGGELIWAGEYDEAEQLLERAKKALRSDIEPATSLLWHLDRGALHAARGEWDRALEQLRSAEEMQTLLVSAHALALHVRALLVVTQVRLGMLDEASESVAAIEDEPEPSAELLTLLALVRHAQGRPQEAIDALAPVLDGSAPVIHEVRVIREFNTVQTQMIAACAWMELGDRRASEAAVEQALALAEPDRLMFPFVLAPGRELLERHPRHATAHAALLIHLLDILQRGSAAAPSGAVELAEPLSPSELRVLGYMPSNLSSPEIAGELILSVNTVKTHLRHIYGKLRAHNRSEAVKIARELGLLGRSPR